MATNWVLFETQLTALLNSKTVKSTDEFADKFSTILDTSIKYQSATLFGNYINISNKSVIKNGLKLALNIGFKVEKYKTDLTKFLAEIQQQSQNLETIIAAIEKIPIPFLSSYVKEYLKKIEKRPRAEQIESLKAFIEKIKIEDLMWFYVAFQISLYYLSATYSPTPPNPPSISPSLGILVTNPGNILILASGLKLAFKSKTAQETASRCKSALEIYTKSISGVYTGITANGTPSITPWIGIF